MKILQVITRGELGGGQRHVMDLLTGLEGYQMEVATGEDGYLVQGARALGIPVHVVPHFVMPISPWEDTRGLIALTQLISRIKPDLVHTHTSKAGILGRMAARLTGIPSIFTAHTWCFSEGTSWKWKAVGIPLEKLVATWSGAIINVSDANRQLALRHRIAQSAKLLTIHNGVPDTPHRAQPERAGVPTIVMVARFAPQKAQAELLHAVKAIELPFRVAFVGDGATRPAHQALADKLGFGDRVDFLGERRDIAEILAAAQIFALPTNWEGFPLTILEGMRAGLPVVASDVGGVGEAVVNGDTGFLVPAGATEQFGARLSQLLADPGMRRQQGAAGRARYEREYTVRAMLDKTKSVYESVLGQNAQSVLSNLPVSSPHEIYGAGRGSR